jgi:two-component system, cell cycle response regulator DivK
MTPRLLLVADDEEDTRLIFSAVLTHVSYDVLVAPDGRAAVEQARLHAPDLILMDLDMPVLDGWEATRALKADPATASIPVVAVTAEDHRLERLREGGFCAYVRKPVVLQTLLRAVEQCLAEVTPETPWIDLVTLGPELRPTP